VKLVSLAFVAAALAYVVPQIMASFETATRLLAH